MAEQLEVDELTPQAIFESVEQLQARASNNLSLSDVDSTQSADLDSHSINQLSTSIRFLSQALSNKHNNQSERPISKDTPPPVDRHNQKPNRQQSKPTTTSGQPLESPHPQSSSTTARQSSERFKSKSPSLQEKKLNRTVSKRTQLAEEEVNRAIDAIIQFNNTENQAHQDKWYIGVSALRKITERGDSVIKRV
ncbi:MAG: hypothetical protein HC930_05460 [Hydrococcus sp. SU_1_0]|nr:hypothetical protein [Hydrococcus sp. SU_1_0]